MAASTGSNKNRTSIKHDIIDKANSNMLIAVSGAVFVVVFCLFATKALIGQAMYQNRVIGEKKTTLKTLEKSSENAKDLQVSYVAFVEESINVLGGNPTGTGPKDGDNAQIVLDALPYELDYPGLSSSLEKILIEGGYQIQALGGDDSNVTGASGTTETATGGSNSNPGTSEPVEIPYPFTVSASPGSALTLLQTLERSIRPFHLTGLKLEGSGNNLGVGINMKTYYKPQVGLQVGEKVVQ